MFLKISICLQKKLKCRFLTKTGRTRVMKGSYCIYFQDVETTVFFSDRVNGDNDLFVGQTTRSFSIKCYEIVDTGIARTVSKQLGAPKYYKECDWSKKWAEEIAENFNLKGLLDWT